MYKPYVIFVSYGFDCLTWNSQFNNAFKSSEDSIKWKYAKFLRKSKNCCQILSLQKWMKSIGLILLPKLQDRNLSLLDVDRNHVNSNTILDAYLNAFSLFFIIHDFVLNF